ncbi:MAG: hypothetical protein ACYCSN_02830 [Acidobacteriaceae bacterium]
MTATFDTTPSALSSRAAQGYILTATGGNKADGFLLVGTRVKGDTMARQLMALSPQLANVAQLYAQGYALAAQGYALAGLLYQTDSNAQVTGQLWVGEK